MSQAGKYAINVTPPPSGVLTLTGNFGGAVGPDGGGNIDLLGTGSVEVDGNPGANTLVISVTGGGIPWVEITGASQTMATDTGYIANRGTTITFSLPALALQGSIFRICGKGSGGYTIAQNAGQTIFFGTSATTTGGGGSLATDDFSNTIELLCITDNVDFRVLSSVGNFTVV